jgi:serralysin
MAVTPTSLETYFLQLVNEARVANGIKPLTVDGELLTAARGHDEYMDAYDAFSHTGLNGSTLSQRITAAGYGWTAAAENIAYASGGLTEATVQTLFNNLMNSPGHRANILNGTYEEVGIGLKLGTYQGREVVFVTQDFGRPNTQERAEADDVGTVVVTPTTPTTPTAPAFTATVLPESGAPTKVYYGNSYNNTMYGSTGNDLLDGRGGSDTMYGRQGDDTYRVNAATDRVIEYAGEGVDTVRSTASSFTLGQNIENLKLVGAGVQTGIGNAGNNILTNNSVAGSTLKGEGGNDILIASSKAGFMWGGEGNDTFVFKTASPGTHIKDFRDGVDDINIDAIAGTYAGSDPVADGYLQFASDGAGGTKVRWDADGTGAGAAVEVCTIDDLAPSAFADWQTDFIV